MVPFIMQMQQWLSIAINCRQTLALPTWASGPPGPPACEVRCLPPHLTSAPPPVFSPSATLSFHCLQAFLLLTELFFSLSFSLLSQLPVLSTCSLDHEIPALGVPGSIFLLFISVETCHPLVKLSHPLLLTVHCIPSA